MTEFLAKLGTATVNVETGQPDRVLVPDEVGRIFNVDAKTVTRWADAGKLPSFRTPGNHRRFYLSEIRACIAKART